MAVDVERLVVQLSAEIRQYNNSLNRAMGVTNRRAKQIETRFQRMNRSVSASFVGLGRGLTGALAVAGGVRGFQSLLDASTRIDNALKVVGHSGEELEGVLERLHKAATDNGAPLETLVGLYTRMSQSQKGLKASSEEIENLTVRIAEALRVQGVSAEQARGPLTQLAQSFSSVIVRAEEFNSLSEGMPIILHAVAAGLKEANGDIGRLRTLVVDGKVSSEAWFRALEAGSVIIQQKVVGATLTVGQGIENMRTEMIKAVGDFAKGSLAAEGLGDAFQMMADSINGINFEEFGREVKQLLGFLNDVREALGWLTNFSANFGEATGLDRLGEIATGGAVQRQIGPVTLTSSRALQDRIDRAFAGAVETAGALTEDAIRRSAGQVVDEQGKTGRLPATTVTPVSLSDFTLPDSDKKGGAKKRADDYERLSARIAETTAEIIAETEVMRQLDPLVEDYGYAVEKARAEQELLSAAKKAGIEVTPKLRKEIADLAEQYALASAEADKLAEAQDKARENAEKWLGVGQDVTKGFIDDLINGKSAAESFANAISKIGDALLDDVLSAIFDIKNASGGGFLGFLGKLFGGFGGGGGFFPSAPGAGLYADGGYTGDGGKYQPKGVVHGGEYVFSKEAVQKAGVGNLEAMHRSLKGYASGGPVGMSIPRIGQRAANDNRPQQMQINVNVDGANGDEHVIRLVQQGVNAGLQQYDRNVAPLTVKRVVNDPRQVG